MRIFFVATGIVGIALHYPPRWAIRLLISKLQRPYAISMFLIVELQITCLDYGKHMAIDFSISLHHHSKDGVANARYGKQVQLR